jgi:putative transposase
LSKRIVALGIDLLGDKKVLGFWQGATENNEICKELLADLEKRGLRVDHNIIFITDGGKGIIKCLRERFGEKLLHQRCTIHKDHNLQRHLAKKYRKLISRKYRTALNHKKYDDAKRALNELEDELRQVNESAANSLAEALPELLTLHRLEVPEELKKSLHTTNAIENLFSTVRHREKNVKNFSPMYGGKEKKAKMSRRWFAAVLITAEKNFNKVKGFDKIKEVRQRIEILQNENVDMKKMSA